MQPSNCQQERASLAKLSEEIAESQGSGDAITHFIYLAPPWTFIWIEIKDFLVFKNKMFQMWSASELYLEIRGTRSVSKAPSNSPSASHPRAFPAPPELHATPRPAGIVPMRPLLQAASQAPVSACKSPLGQLCHQKPLGARTPALQPLPSKPVNNTPNVLANSTSL